MAATFVASLWLLVVLLVDAAPSSDGVVPSQSDRPRHLPRFRDCYRIDDDDWRWASASSRKTVAKAAPCTAPQRAVALQRFGLDDSSRATAQFQFLKAVTDAANDRFVGIPRLVDFCHCHGDRYLVQQYFEGQPLSRLNLSRRVLLSSSAKKTLERTLLRLLFKIVAVLNFAHSRGYVHLGLGLDCILRDQHDNVLIRDFSGLRVGTADRAGVVEVGRTSSLRHRLPAALRNAAQFGYGDDVLALGRLMEQLMVACFMSESSQGGKMRTLIQAMKEGDANRRPSTAALLRHRAFRSTRAFFGIGSSWDGTQVEVMAAMFSLQGRNRDHFAGVALPPIEAHTHADSIEAGGAASESPDLDRLDPGSPEVIFPPKGYGCWSWI